MKHLLLVIASIFLTTLGRAQSWPGSGTKHIATPWPAGMYFIVLTDDQGKQHSTSLLLTK